MSEHRQGPVRSEAARVAVLDATARLFAARGYDHLTMEGVAAEAGVSKQTIYRWWPSKGSIVADCLLEGRLLIDSLAPPDNGDVRADLVGWIGEVFGVAERAVGETLLQSVIAAAADNPDVGQRLHDALAVEGSIIDRLQLGVDAGQLAVDAPVAELAEALVGAVILRALSRKPADPESAQRLVLAILGPAAA